MKKTLKNGFSLVEMILGLLLMTILATAVLQWLESSTRAAAAQIGRAELQQALRTANHEIARHARHAGRGGLPPAVAVNVDSNVEPNRRILKTDSPDDTGVPNIVAGTDILTLRGMIHNPVWWAKPSSLTYDPVEKVGRIVLRSTTPAGRLPQNLELLSKVKNSRVPEAVLISGATGDDVYGVALVERGATTIHSSGDRVTLAFRFTGDERAEVYARLSTNATFPINTLQTTGIGRVGILEEYRFYVREEERDDGIHRVLCRARVLPGHEEVWSSESHLRREIVENVIDFQVALAAPRQLRLTTLVQSRHPHRHRRSARLVRLEDKDYERAVFPFNSFETRSHLRAHLTSLVHLRNL